MQAFRPPPEPIAPARGLGPTGPFPRAPLGDPIERRWLHYAFLSRDGRLGMVANAAWLGPDREDPGRRTRFTTILLLHEQPPWQQILGIVLVSGGVIAIGFSHRATVGALTGLAYALGTGITIGIYTLIDASGVRSVPVAFTYVLWFFVAHGFSVLVTAPGIRGRAVIIEARKQWKLGAVTAALSIVTYGSAMLAYRYGATAQLAALRETSVLFGTALAMSFLGERMTARRWIAAIVIAAGAILLQAG